MKPIKLEMTAFGSYAQPTTVDFRELKHSLYLITGDTGAGKTTIFDGIMFALYGVASGEGDKRFRTFEMMHCDYVDRSQDTILRLEFEQLGRSYVVERELHFIKKRSTGEYEETEHRAKFWEPDREVRKGPNAVTARITELLGMSADQFRKIVMLAQGEFKKFLDSDSEKKNEILGELFDNSAYVWYQEIFDRARKKLALRRQEEGEAKIRRAMEDFLLPKELSGEAQEVFTPGHSGLEEALEQLTKEDKDRLQELEEKLSQCRREENTLREALGEAAEQNKKLEELGRKREALCKLQEKQPEMQALKGQIGRVEQAFYKIVPKQTAFATAERIYRDTMKRIQHLSEQCGDLKREKAGKKKALEICLQEQEPAIQELAREIGQIDKALPQYDELKKASDEQQKEQKAAEQAQRKRVRAEAEREQALEKIRRLKEEIDRLDVSRQTVPERQAALANAVKDLEKLTARGGIKEQTEEIRRRERELKKEKTRLQKLTERTRDLEEGYHNTYQAFIRGQAGLLAKDLEQELLEKDEAACPVCRTLFRSGKPHAFARLLEGTPERGEVDRAKAAFEKEEGERQKGSDKVTGHEAELRSLKENLLARLRELKPECPRWEVLEGTSYLEEVIGEYESRRTKAEQEFDLAAQQLRHLEDRKEECTRQERALKKWEEDFETYRARELEHTHNSQKQEAVLGQLKKGLQYPNKETAELRQRELCRERKQREKKISDAREAYQETEKQYNSMAGALESSQNSLPGFQKDKEDAESSLTETLKAQGFQSPKEVDLLLEQAGDSDRQVEDWLQFQKKEIESYDNDLKNTKRRITELEQETENRKPTDLLQLRDRIRALETSHKEMQGSLDLCRQQHENHRKTTVTVKEANWMLKNTEGVWKRLNSLADLAIGVNSEGGKISFDRYVMGYVFQEVLNMANMRLDLMSGGRYELMHERSAGRNNAKAGLEIAVLDRTTGKCRSATSLSGGESFFVSLALALGLSDVVQNHAGGKRLDALFIDEGFGTLDDDVLENALGVLNQLTEGQRLVGIISHVAKLEESIPQQIQVKNGEKGSTLKIVC